MIDDNGNPGDESGNKRRFDQGGQSSDHIDRSNSPGAAGGSGGGQNGENGSDEDPQRSLRLSLQDAEAKADEYWNELLRTRAELANLQRRAERDVSNAHKYGLERFAGELLPVVDGLELGLNAAAGSSESEKLREGTELTLKLLMTALEKFAITPIEPEGEKFNPELHQAMAMQPVEGVEPNTVVTVYQKGWRLHDRLLRPAMVVVAGSNTSAAGAAAAGQNPGEEYDGGRDSGGKIDEKA